MIRKLTPEILDGLPADDPGAMRSRRDLQRINGFMGNESWILAQIPASTSQITELGAGDGGLLEKIHRKFPQTPTSAIELMPRPAGLPKAIAWTQADIFDAPMENSGGTVIANLFLHHFTDEQLTSLGQGLATYDTIIINEPLRARLPQFLGKLASPLVNAITRHDMRVSIEAGFIEGEIPSVLGLNSEQFRIAESSTWRGSQRVLALRR